MKIIPQATFTAKDILDEMHNASTDLPVGKKLPNGFTIRVRREGAISHLYLYDEMNSAFVGVASVQKDKISTLSPSIAGLRVFQTGLLKKYRGFGFVYRVISSLLDKYRVFASPSMTESGKKMWASRMLMDHKHAYLIYSPHGFDAEVKGKVVSMPFFKVDKYNHKVAVKLAWDGSLTTRLLAVKPNDPILKRYF